MPLGINKQDLFTNAQFQQFVEFAQTSKAGSIAQTTAAPLVPDGKPHSIAGTTENWFSKLIRSSAAKEANNYTRTIFRDSIAKMFGGENNIPDSVKDAMKMADYDKGKPLTARRILAVKAAIDQVAEQFTTGVEANKAKFAKSDKNGQASKLIETAFTACQGNTDAMDIVNQSMKLIIVNAEAQFRSEEKVQKTVEGLVSNLNELKALSTKNPGIYAAGKNMLLEPCKPLPKGMLTKIVQALNDMSINDLRKLSGSSSGMNIHKTLNQFFKNISEIMVSTGVEKKLDGADEKEAVRLFIAQSLLSRCSQGTMGKIRDALNSNTTGQLNDFYQKCGTEDTDFFNKEELNVQRGTSTVGSAGSTYLNIMEECLNRNLKRVNPNAARADVIRNDPEVQYNIEHIGGKELLADMVSLAKESNERDVKVYIDFLVDGSGQGADTFKAHLKKKLGNINLPMNYLPYRLGLNEKAMMNRNICTEMKKIALGKESQFQKDVYRSGTITLIDGKKTFTLSKEFNTARDELAQFVTGNQQATYQSLEATDKNKVHLMMAMLCQETEKAGEDGALHAIHPRESEDAFILGGDEHNPGTRKFTLEKNYSGGFMLEYSMEKPITSIRPVDEYDDISVGEGSSFSCSLRYDLKEEEVQRLAELDYTKFNDDEASNLTNHKQEMPDGTKQYAEEKLMKAVDTFAQEFKIDAGGGMDFNMKLMPSDEDKINEARQWS